MTTWLIISAMIVVSVCLLSYAISSVRCHYRCEKAYLEATTQWLKDCRRAYELGEIPPPPPSRCVCG